ncbi:MAG: hypothetical protein R3301_18240, partial [Saprospiraceae bacterium]|nr:hypothetical protein [Saprospiraceae bacterium]
GYWGKALTYLHPIWPDVPTAAMLEDGLQHARLAARRASTQREKLFSNALIAYYQDAEDKSESERLAAYEAAWKAAYDALPDDLEAKSFYILAHLATADPGDKTYAKQLHAGPLAEEILEEIPDHPAGFHYVIHAYDYPPLAEKALDIARGYGKIAPEIPHALHMPTHIFTRLGYWDESIDWNLRSAAAALNYPVNGAVSLHHFHALDYLVYAYLQQGRDQEAMDVYRNMLDLPTPWQTTFPTAYALAAMPGRIALERKDWEEAAALGSRIPAHYDWDKAPEFEAMHEFARGLGAARSGKLQAARKIHDRMTELQTKVANTSKNSYWMNQIEIQKKAVMAWVLYAEGKADQALAMMEESADMESKTSKNPVTPGEVLPARELLADMYAETGRHAEAIASYDLALERSPNRYNSLLGAYLSAQALGDAALAGKYRTAFDALTAQGTAARVQQARDAMI